ncbi:MAG: hypothetical protein ACJ762_00400 [Solirubrobacteraceae bacterium]
MNPVGVAKAVSAGRLVFGVAMMAAPSKVMAGWVGEKEAQRPAFDLLTRSFGAREILLGFIGVHVSGTPGVGKRTIGTMALMDLTDLAVTVAHRRNLPSSALPIMVGVAGGAVVSQVWAARELP